MNPMSIVNEDVLPSNNGASVLPADPKMRELMARYGRVTLKRRSEFLTLCRSVIAQQISTKAADTIRQKFHQRFGQEPGALARASLHDIQRCGVSSRKAACLRDLANGALAGEFEKLYELPDEQITDRLTAIKGIGPWTAEMFLIFSLARPNVWPLRDAGLRTAARRVYEISTIEEVECLGSRFVPLRSIAAVYLWRSLENAEHTH